MSTSTNTKTVSLIATNIPTSMAMSTTILMITDTRTTTSMTTTSLIRMSVVMNTLTSTELPWLPKSGAR